VLEDLILTCARSGTFSRPGRGSISVVVVTLLAHTPTVPARPGVRISRRS
jgi:hypothetical protein